jgi:hypothetical protein
MPGGEANAIFYLVDRAGLEGIVSKRLGSKYRSGNTTAWLKTKSYTVSDLELLGVERERGKPAFALMGEPGTRKYDVAFQARPTHTVAGRTRRSRDCLSRSSSTACRPMVLLASRESVRVFRVFQNTEDVIDFAKKTIPRELTACERRRFFLPVEGKVGDCPN